MQLKFTGPTWVDGTTEEKSTPARKQKAAAKSVESESETGPGKESEKQMALPGIATNHLPRRRIAKIFRSSQSRLPGSEPGKGGEQVAMAYAEENRKKSLAYYHANKHTDRAKENRRRYNEKRRQGRPAKGDYGPRKPKVIPGKKSLPARTEPNFI